MARQSLQLQNRGPRHQEVQHGGGQGCFSASSSVVALPPPPCFVLTGSGKEGKGVEVGEALPVHLKWLPSWSRVHILSGVYRQ